MRIYQMSCMDEFEGMKARLIHDLKSAPTMRRTKWQQLDVGKSDMHRTHELSNVVINCMEVPGSMARLQADIEPDLPWAEDHFQERVGGEPINPGVAHAYWPYHGHSMQEHLRGMGGKGEHYDHNYMERMWARGIEGFQGYRFDVGDLGSVVELLRREWTTRQAYLPLWFPEDTGVQDGQRVPCTLGYHFIGDAEGNLHMTYFLRACEAYRHFTNDVYLATRLQQWVAQQVGASMGEFTMHVANMHLFVGDVDRV